METFDNVEPTKSSKPGVSNPVPGRELQTAWKFHSLFS